MHIEHNFSISPSPLKGLHKDSLKVRELFWEIKIEIYFLGKKKKNRDTKWAHILHLNCKYIFLWKQAQYKTQRVIFVWIGTVLICCGGVFNGNISQVCEVRVRSTRLIGGKLLKTSLLILMSIAHSYSLLRISYLLTSPYCSGTDRVVIASIEVLQCMWQ